MQIYFTETSMSKKRAIVAVLGGALFAALVLWDFQGDEARQFDALREKALCVMELRAGAPSALASFRTSHAVRPVPGRRVPRAGFRSRSPGAMALCVALPQIPPVLDVETSDLPPGTYEITFRREAGDGGVIVVLAGEESVYVTGWQIVSRIYLGVLALSAVWAPMAQGFKNARVRYFFALGAQCRYGRHQFLQVVGRTHPAPLRAHLLQSAQEETTHLEDVLDDRKRCVGIGHLRRGLNPVLLPRRVGPVEFCGNLLEFLQVFLRGGQLGRQRRRSWSIVRPSANHMKSMLLPQAYSNCRLERIRRISP